MAAAPTRLLSTDPRAPLGKLLRLQPPDLVTMGLEGGESPVLSGAVRLLSQRRAIWLVALHVQQQKQECWEILDSHSRAIYRLDGVQVVSPAEMPDEIDALPVPEGVHRS